MVDDMQRDNDTARAVLRGLQMDENSFVTDAAMFDGVTRLCFLSETASCFPADCRLSDGLPRSALPVSTDSKRL